MNTSWPLSRIAGEGAERSEAGEGLDRWRFRRAFSTSCVIEFRFPG
jgi:hypothetical protein